MMGSSLQQWAMVGGCFLLSSFLSRAASPPLDDARAALQEWVAVEQTISREAADWREKQASLQDRIAVLEQEHAALQVRITQHRNGIAAIDGERDELTVEQERIDALQGMFTEFAGQAESRLRDLRTTWSTPLNERLEPLYQRLPRDPQNSSLGVAERMQNITAILTEAQQFDGKLTLTRELRTYASGEEGEVQVLYIGLGQAYYVGPGGTHAGHGHPTANGWVWKSQPELATAVEEAIAIHENATADARFVSLPITIRTTE